MTWKGTGKQQKSIAGKGAAYARDQETLLQKLKGREGAGLVPTLVECLPKINKALASILNTICVVAPACDSNNVGEGRRI